MKDFYQLLAALLLAAFVAVPQAPAAVTVHSKDGRSLELPERFLVEAEGISFHDLARDEIGFIEWQEVDLRRLALTRIEIDSARLQAIETGERVYIQQVPSRQINYYRAFLNQKIHVRFNSRFTFRGQEREEVFVSSRGFPGPQEMEEVWASRDRFISGESAILREIAERTRYPLDTTVEGLFMVLGRDNRHARDLIRELQVHGAFFENLAIGLRNLEEVYPGDPEIARTRRAIDSLSSGRTIGFDDQRQLLRFVEHARRQGG
jgi:hypothetical protein